MKSDPHDLDTPSAWVTRWAERVPAGGLVLDVACGAGRHARYFARCGHPVVAVDRDPATPSRLAGIRGISVRCADLEQGSWPFSGEHFSGIVVTNYLHRPLFPYLLSALAPAGALIYETFAAGNERFGRPSNPAFLLKSGELLEVTRGKLQVIAYEDLFVTDPKPAMVQRICATNSLAGE